MPILGVVENMCEFVCPCCSTATQLFPTTTGGAKKMCTDLHLELLAQLPLEPKLAKSLDEGNSYFEHFANSSVSKKIIQLAEEVVQKCRTDKEFS